MKKITHLNVSPDSFITFCQRWQVTELALFGSILEDDFRGDSDVDVLVTFQAQARWTLWDMVRMQEELQQIFGREVDLIDREGVEASRNPIRREAILSSAEVIYRLADIAEQAEFEAGLQQLQALRHRETHQARDDAAAQIASQRQSQLEQIESICQHYQVAELALFGSVLRDDFDTDSDIDILVSFEPTAQIGLIAFNQLQAELTRLFNRPVDLVPKQGLKPFIKETVLQQAKVIYARS